MPEFDQAQKDLKDLRAYAQLKKTDDKAPGLAVFEVDHPSWKDYDAGDLAALQKALELDLLISLRKEQRDLEAGKELDNNKWLALRALEEAHPDWATNKKSIGELEDLRGSRIKQDGSITDEDFLKMLAAAFEAAFGEEKKFDDFLTKGHDKSVTFHLPEADFKKFLMKLLELNPKMTFTAATLPNGHKYEAKDGKLWIQTDPNRPYAVEQNDKKEKDDKPNPTKDTKEKLKEVKKEGDTPAVTPKKTGGLP